uniref:Uncharacterized protein n=1 Tax=Onchocerca volvulus TaxID=6282 RepID=A0A8R1XZY2_ONCVO
MGAFAIELINPSKRVEVLKYRLTKFTIYCSSTKIGLVVDVEKVRIVKFADKYSSWTYQIFDQSFPIVFYSVFLKPTAI